MKADAGPPSPRCTLHAYGTSAPLRVPKAPGENRPAGPAGGKAHRAQALGFDPRWRPLREDAALQSLY